MKTADKQTMERVNNLADRLIDLLPRLSDEQRLEVFATLSKGYCPYCGGKNNERGICYCTYDD